MTRLPRSVFHVVFACSLSVPIAWSGWASAQTAGSAAPAAPANPAPAPANATTDAAAASSSAAGQPAAAAPANDQELKEAVENFWHYGKIARYDLAAEAAQQILAAKDKPQQILEDFEQVAQERNDDLDLWIIRWQGIDAIKQQANQIMGLLNEGRRARRANPAHIEENIKRLNRPGRPYQIAVQQLRDSGELAVPMMIDYLRDPSKQEYSTGIRRALIDIGRPALNPLLASTEMKTQQTLIEICNVIGDIGYNVSVPYLARLANGQDQPQAVRLAASQALERMGIADPRTLNAAEQFYQLSEKFYYDTADIQADRRDPNAPANVWYWNETNGLERKQVPQQIFNEIMSMRTSEYALKLGAQRGDALSLWLAANYKREVQLPAGATDTTRAENQPSAHFYGVDAGPQYLNNALSRTLRDHDWPVALRVVRSLEQIGGNSTLFPGNVAPLVEAMASPDRPVRFEAAFAVASAMPNKMFAGQERVVPLLAEALSQTGTPSIVLVLPSQDRVNQIVDELKKQNINAVGAVGADAGVAAAGQLAAVDALVVSEELGAPEVDRLLALAAQNQKLAGASKIVITKTNASPYAVRAATDPNLSVTQQSDAAGIKAAAEAARAKASAAIDPQQATAYALRAAQLLQELAMGRAVFDLSPAEAPTLSALRDARPEVVKTAGNALGWMNSRDAQAAMLAVAANDKTGDDVKISLYRSIATNAKNFGNRLTAEQVNQLDRIVESVTNNDVKSAAAEARGALNLPPDQAKNLIVKQSRV